MHANGQQKTVLCRRVHHKILFKDAFLKQLLKYEVTLDLGSCCNTNNFLKAKSQQGILVNQKPIPELLETFNVMAHDSQIRNKITPTMLQPGSINYTVKFTKLHLGK